MDRDDDYLCQLLFNVEDQPGGILIAPVTLALIPRRLTTFAFYAMKACLKKYRILVAAIG